MLLAPAYTFLMSNRPVDYQFWLDVGSTGWWERLYQPLTHPYVLSPQVDKRQPVDRPGRVRRAPGGVGCLMLGLVRRCRRQIYLGLSEMGERASNSVGRCCKSSSKS